MARFVALCACLLITLGALPEHAESAEASRTTLQIAAIHGMKHTDARAHILLESGSVRVRIYPGTDTMLVAGQQWTVKDRFVRSGGDVLVTARVQRFLSRQIASAQAAERTRAARAKRIATPLPVIEPLPPRPVRVKRKPLKTRTAPTVKPTAHAAVRADRGWKPAVRERDWKWIVLHHSDDTSGNLAKYDDIHRNVNKWENGCGYHFVVGNGSMSGDGQIEIGPRWEAQLQGAHAKVAGNRFNERGIGICLVGDFDEGGARPTPAQMDELVRLIRYLKATYGIQDCDVRGHKDCCATRCPGKNFPWAELRQRTR